MKKITLILILTILITGCSTENKEKLPIKEQTKELKDQIKEIEDFFQKEMVDVNNQLTQLHQRKNETRHKYKNDLYSLFLSKGIKEEDIHLYKEELSLDIFDYWNTGERKKNLFKRKSFIEKTFIFTNAYKKNYEIILLIEKALNNTRPEWKELVRTKQIILSQKYNPGTETYFINEEKRLEDLLKWSYNTFLKK